MTHERDELALHAIELRELLDLCLLHLVEASVRDRCGRLLREERDRAQIELGEDLPAGGVHVQHSEQLVPVDERRADRALHLDLVGFDPGEVARVDLALHEKRFSGLGDVPRDPLSEPNPASVGMLVPVRHRDYEVGSFRQHHRSGVAVEKPHDASEHRVEHDRELEHVVHGLPRFEQQLHFAETVGQSVVNTRSSIKSRESLRRCRSFSIARHRTRCSAARPRYASPACRRTRASRSSATSR